MNAASLFFFVGDKLAMSVPGHLIGSDQTKGLQAWEKACETHKVVFPLLIVMIGASDCSTRIGILGFSRIAEAIEVLARGCGVAQYRTINEI